MGYPPLHRGDRNVAVKAAQNSLHRTLAKRGIAHRNKRNGVYGALTAKDVENLEVEFKIRPVTPQNIGVHDWAVLRHNLSAWDRTMLATYRAQQAAKALAEAARREQAARQRVADEALRLYRRGGLVYVQRRPFPLSDDLSDIRYRLDCSSFATLCFWLAGLPDPNGWHYAGKVGSSGAREVYGWTGSLWGQGRAVAAPAPGDLAFYGWDPQRGAPVHTAVCVGGGQVVSFGSTPVRLLAVDYRPVLGYRRYPVKE